MNPRSAALVALLAAGFVYQPESPAPPSRAKERLQAPATPSSTVVYDKELQTENWPREKMHEFFTTRDKTKEEAEQDICPLPVANHVDFIVATVPDPQNSHYPVMFDRFVESIRRASEDKGYVLDRFWLPWDADPGPPDTDWLKREHHEDWQKRKQDYPGILVFRAAMDKSDTPEPEHSKIMGVLLVGENPLTGINKQQFANAVSLVRHFERPPEMVKILGPTFSGSIHSLSTAILGACGQTARATKYHVITGSATGAKNKAAFQRLFAAYHDDYPLCQPGQPEITYDSVIENDSVAFDKFFSYLDPDFHVVKKTNWLHHDVELNRVAILAEAGSEYASQLLEAAKDRQAAKDNQADKDKQADKHNEPGDSRYLILHYPMEISRLRNAYEDDPELSVLASNRAGELPHQALQIRLKDAHDAEDSVPSFSGELTPVSKEAALLNTISTISRQRIEYVGIIASDILDAIFLGRFLKQHCPDVRLFIFDSDLTYAHLAQNYAFQGMLMVTSYPLFDANQRWTNSWGGNRQRRQFPSATAEGAYNASLMLLNELQLGGKDAPLLEYPLPQGSGEKFASRPLWLTVVGRDGVWPVAKLDAKEDTSPAGNDRDNSLSLPLLDDPSRAWVLASYVLKA